MFGFFKKKSPQRPAPSGSFPLDGPDIADIWRMEDANNFVVAMYLHVAKKCGYGAQMEALTQAERTFYVAQELEAEVNNGGFSQFFYNSSGDFSGEVAEAFAAIGAQQTAQLCKRAIASLGCPLPPLRARREEVLDRALTDAAEAVLAACDDAFYRYEEDLTELNRRFILQHRAQFT